MDPMQLALDSASSYTMNDRRIEARTQVAILDVGVVERLQSLVAASGQLETSHQEMCTS